MIAISKVQSGHLKPAENLIFSISLIPFSLPKGGLFEAGDEALELAFKYAIERVNADKKILPNTKLVAKVERLEKADSFQASRKGKLSSK